MDSSYGCRTWRPCSHHHQFQHHCSHHHHHHHHFLSPHHHHHHCHPHHHFLPNCPLHSFQSRPNTHSHLCPKFTSPPFLQNPELTAPVSSSLSLNFQVSESSDNAAADAQMIPGGNEEGLEAEEEEEYLYVLTDEWKELFAKSDAKRRLAKKQAKKKRRN